ncbi:MAG: hypothetical protein RIF36_23265 [Imperialibacter sp.]|uniref:hypothetical protein n=1 Tax=Imperialibacter sp. TaxID=2038411 RepID=UPI0032ED8C11
MKTITNLLTPAFCLLLNIAIAQPKSFELSNPNAIVLNDQALATLTGGYWRVFEDATENKGHTLSSPMNVSLCYYPNGKFFYNGSFGCWKVIDDKYIEHTFDDKADQDKLNFGGIFSLTELSSTSLRLTKLLTTTHDMKRTMQAKSSTVLTKSRQLSNGLPYMYDGKLDQETVDSLSMMSAEELFNAGFTLSGNSIHIFSTDSIYVIRLKAK